MISVCSVLFVGYMQSEVWLAAITYSKLQKTGQELTSQDMTG